MDRYGHFTVSDDPDGVIAVALLVATTSENSGQIETQLKPGGGGLRVETIGAIDQIFTRDDLPYPFEDDPNLDPETQELWWLFREPDSEYSYPGHWVMTGEELRDLVHRALALRREAGFER